ncbi:MAG: rhodanese-like domain-containing protein [Vulcanimicrobiota bacterium]
MRTAFSQAWTLVSLSLAFGLLLNHLRGLPLHPLRPYREAQKAPAIQLRLAYPQSPTYLDARPRKAYQAGHVPGALNYPGGSVGRSWEFRPGMVVAYCDPHCGLAAYLAEQLIALGQTRVYVLEGGVAAWQEAGLPLQEGDQP